MRLYDVDVKVFVKITLDADSAKQARERAESLIAMIEPTDLIGLPYGVTDLTFNIDGEPDVSES